ncbi:MAG: hypothetical protein IAC61_03015 [Firmicutes bacterium]|uniref:Uncharacterized protein n=1 Tax=Candidatus Alloenteromonas pullistercoris TaxID=2840785 RepID=A0A9D9DEP2_9FIRM|nr:hypothetical protein [Candidatus Enteromonas pullistercoris]
MKHIHAKIACAVLGAAFAVGIGTSLDYGESPEIASPSPSLRKAIETRASSVTAEQSIFTAIRSNNIGGDTNVSYECAKGGGTSNPGVYSDQIRLYQNNEDIGGDGGQITIKVADGYKITSLTIGSGQSTTIRYLVNGVNGQSNISISNGGKYTVDSANHLGVDISSVTVICNGKDKNSRLNVNYLSVTYEPLVDTPSDAVLSSLTLEQGTAPTEVYQNADVDVSGYLLTGTYTSPSTPEFSSELAILPNDENLTWNYDTSELGEAEISATYNDGNVNIDSNALTINVVEVPDGQYYYFGEHPDFSDSQKWDSGYEARTMAYPGEFSITFASANKQSQIITDMPVSKGNEATLTSEKPMSKIEFGFKQWNTRENTASLYIDGGSTAVDRAAFLDGVSSVSYVSDSPFSTAKVDWSNSSNQVGWEYVYIEYASVEPSEAESYAEMFIEFMTCDGEIGAITAEEGTWEVLSDLYAGLSDSDKRILKEATPNEHSESLVEQAVARYDYIVGKYGVEQYPDFMDRTPARIAEARSVDVNDQTAAWVIAGISAAGIASAAAFFFLRRRKEA